MSKAKEGLRAAMLRSTAGVVTLAEMDTTEIIAGLTDEQKASMKASFTETPAAADTTPGASAGEGDPNEGEPDGDPDDTKCKKCGEVKKDGKCTKCDSEANAVAEASDPVAAAVAGVHARYATVMASEHYAGREPLAQSLLGNDKLSADEIVTALAAAPKGSSASSEDDSAGAVLDAIRSSNAVLDSSGTNASQPTAKNHGWGDIHAEMRERRGINR